MLQKGLESGKSEVVFDKKRLFLYRNTSKSYCIFCGNVLSMKDTLLIKDNGFYLAFNINLFLL